MAAIRSEQSLAQSRPTLMDLSRRPISTPYGYLRAVNLLVSWLPSVPRPAVAALIERLIEKLDELDGDSDLECDGCDEEISLI